MSFAASFPGFRLRPTRWGIGYLAGCLVLGLAAVNTGNNALMAVLGLALGSYVVSGIWSRQVLGGLSVAAHPPVEVFAGRPTVLEVELENRSRIFPAYGVVVRDHDGRAIVSKDLLEADESFRRSTEVVFTRRGWHRLGPWSVEVLLPLGFFVKSKSVVFDEPVLVYPRLLPTARSPARRGGGRRAPDAMEARGREGEVVQLRGFREGDELRALHWKQTARQQTLVVVERQKSAQRPVIFVLDTRLENPADEEQRARFERLVSEIATGAVRRLREGVPVGLVLGPTVVPSVRSLRRARFLLAPLAEVKPGGLATPPPSDPGVRRFESYSVLEPTA